MDCVTGALVTPTHLQIKPGLHWNKLTPTKGYGYGVKDWVDSIQPDPGFVMAHSMWHKAGVIVIIFTRTIINLNPSHHFAQWLEHLNYNSWGCVFDSHLGLGFFSWAFCWLDFPSSKITMFWLIALIMLHHPPRFFLLHIDKLYLTLHICFIGDHFLLHIHLVPCMACSF